MLLNLHYNLMKSLFKENKMDPHLKAGDYIWIDNSNNNDIPDVNLLAVVLDVNKQQVKVRTIQHKLEMTCYLDNSGVWGVGRKADIKFKKPISWI